MDANNFLIRRRDAQRARVAPLLRPTDRQMSNNEQWSTRKSTWVPLDNF